MNRTQETYSKIAHSYLKANRNRFFIRKAMRRFVSLLPDGATVLDVGCGPGFDSAELLTHNIFPVSLDLSLTMMQVGRTQFECNFVQADMCNLPIKQVDGIWANASLLHLPRATAITTLSEFARCLRSEGVLYLAVKSGDGEGWTKRSYGHAEPRFFCYWQPDQLDEALSAEFDIHYRIENKVFNTSSWLLRIAKKRAY